MTGTCKRCNETSGSIKCGEFLDWLRTNKLLKKPEINSQEGICFMKAVKTSVKTFTKTLENEESTLPRNIGKQLPLDAESFSRKAESLSTPR